LIKPVLRPPEKHQLGYNNILLPHEQVISDEIVVDAAALLKLTPENVRACLSQGVALPVTYTANRVEAELVTERLRELGLHSLTVSDDELGNTVRRVRSMRFDDDSLTINQAGAAEQICWGDIVLIVTDRLVDTRIEIK